MNTSSAPVRQLEKFTSFSAEIELGRPASGSVREFPRWFATEGGKVFVKQSDGTTVELPQAITEGGMAFAGALSIMPADSGTNAAVVWVGW